MRPVDPRVARFAGPIAAFVAMIAIVMTSAAVIFVRKVGLAPARVQAHFLGSEAAFTEPRSLAGMMEVALPHLLAIPIVVFVTLHLVAFATRPRRRGYLWASGVTFACAAAGIASGFAIRWAWPALAPLKVAAFVGFEATLATWLGLLALAVLPGRQVASGPARTPSPAARAPAVSGPAAGSSRAFR